MTDKQKQTGYTKYVRMLHAKNSTLVREIQASYKANQAIALALDEAQNERDKLRAELKEMISVKTKMDEPPCEDGDCTEFRSGGGCYKCGAPCF